MLRASVQPAGGRLTVAVPSSEQRRVCQRSGDRCAFEGCRRALSIVAQEIGDVVVLGEIAHIIAERPDGPRGDASVPLKQRNAYPNLMLLCQEHHQLVDSKPQVYGVERLHAMKEAHEVWVDRQLGRGVETVALPAPNVEDVLYSTMLPVERMPRYIYAASSSARYPSDVTPGIAPRCVTPFVLHRGQLWAFQDLSDKHGPFASVVETASCERTELVQMAADPDGHRLLQRLLNRCLNKLTGRRGLMLDKEHHRYYFPAEKVGVTRSVSYTPLNKSSATRKVVWQPTRKSGGQARKYWLHRAVNLQFVQISPHGKAWVLTLRPELHVSADGVAPYPSKAVGRRVTRKKARLFNYDLLGELQFWRDFLSSASPRITLRFNDSQLLVISTSLVEGTVVWPGIPDEYSRPFQNVRFLDDLFSWAEAEPEAEHDNAGEDEGEDSDALTP